MQTKTHSFIEACINVGSGYLIALVTQMVVFPLYGIHQSFQNNAQIAFIFMCISLIRMYVFRRIFNKIS